MVRRNLKHMWRYPGMTLLLAGMPIVFLPLFVYVFGGTLGNGLGGSGGRAAYVNYVAPAIILMTITAVNQGTAISVAMDMNEGIVARFRTMAIARVSVLTGHVLRPRARRHVPADLRRYGPNRAHGARAAAADVRVRRHPVPRCCGGIGFEAGGRPGHGLGWKSSRQDGSSGSLMTGSSRAQAMGRSSQVVLSCSSRTKPS